jgi:hypothetical protein
MVSESDGDGVGKGEGLSTASCDPASCCKYGQISLIRFMMITRHEHKVEKRHIW